MVESEGKQMHGRKVPQTKTGHFSLSGRRRPAERARTAWRRRLIRVGKRWRISSAPRDVVLLRQEQKIISSPALTKKHNFNQSFNKLSDFAFRSAGVA
ncbi:hypothetical protein [Chromobacterium sphagni]|uniref:hypothetical protein n=1 Tax=Chromobacterium sphagni TaxID=1903179 RepID=UPI001113D5C4|nr:hypothetical protein [Chromobacterium sphagni]